ncbi:MAG: hypothetical protein KDC38_15775 [Planctomycetes bacterium]|nr:hypothetical protein [Planctomycetota bacterium]
MSALESSQRSLVRRIDRLVSEQHELLRALADVERLHPPKSVVDWGGPRDRIRLVAVDELTRDELDRFGEHERSDFLYRVSDRSMARVTFRPAPTEDMDPEVLDLVRRRADLEVDAIVAFRKFCDDRISAGDYVHFNSRDEALAALGESNHKCVLRTLDESEPGFALIDPSDFESIRDGLRAETEELDRQLVEWNAPKFAYSTVSWGEP